MRVPSFDDAVIHGVDFTSAPRRRKGITIASGDLTTASGDLTAAAPGGKDAPARAVLRLSDLHSLHDFTGFSAWLRRPGPWIGAFDLPFSLPRELVETLGWPTDWPRLVAHYRDLDRAEIRRLFKAFCDARPAGGKFAHRATDFPAGSSPSMKWVNPPVAFMMHAGVPLLLDAGVTLAGVHAGDPLRLAFEGYPGMLARSITPASYKNDTKALQTPARAAAREVIVAALEAGDHPLGIALDAGGWRDALVEDASGDLLDATLCALLAAWAWQRREDNYGLPAFDALEGWIVAAGHTPPRAREKKARNAEAQNRQAPEKKT